MSQADRRENEPDSEYHQRLDRIAAELVMGWHVHPWNTAHYDSGSLDALESRFAIGISDWKPTRKMEQAWMIEEEIFRRGDDLAGKYAAALWTIISKPLIYLGNVDLSNLAHHYHAPPIARVRAAIEACEFKSTVARQVSTKTPTGESQ